MRPLALSCRPRWAIGRRNTDRSSPPAPSRTRRRAVAEDRLTGILRLVPQADWPRTFSDVVCSLLEIAYQLRYCKRKALEVPWSGPRKASMVHRLLRHFLSVVAGAPALLAAAQASPASAAGEDILLAPHRAVYDMSLAAARGGSGVTAVSGRMVYELTGSACEGYTQNMRFVTQMTNQGGTAMITDLRSSSWEEGNGRRFRFNSSQFRDEKPTEATAGDAARANTADDIKVELTKPAKKGRSLSARVYFPIQHSIALLQAAKEGKTSFRADLYDGSEKGEKVYDTVSIIGRHRPAGANRQLPLVKSVEALDGLEAWPVSIGYFEPGSDHTDAVPVYELSFLFFENGVSRNMFIDYGEFSMRGELKEIVFHPPSKCETKSSPDLNAQPPTQMDRQR